jgi:hypothetical protein
MMKRIVALVVIFACSWTAWALLTLVIHVRTDEKSDSMSDAVGQLWGDQQIQVAPSLVASWRTETRREIRRAGVEWEYVEPEAGGEMAGAGEGERQVEGEDRRSAPAFETTLVSKEIMSEKTKRAAAEPRRGASKGKEEWVERKYEVSVNDHTAPLTLAGSDIGVDLDVAHRKKGLLWFATYGVAFDARYRVVNPYDHPVTVTARFDYPGNGAVYDNMMIKVSGREDLDVDTEHGQMIGRFTVPAQGEQEFTFAYQSRGMDRWGYRFGNDVRLVENFALTMVTNFEEIDFPVGSISPDVKARTADGAGWTLEWKKESLVSGLDVGMLMPHKINPGPLAAAMSFHAPVSLFFFFFVMFILQTLKGLRIHPMNYFFIAASFFAFNLLFSYLVNHMDIYLAFGASSVVSIFLVVSYLGVVVGTRFALVEAGLCQLAYQVLFSLAHFFDGYTGLTVTIGAIITLALVMRLTARVDWGDVFGRKSHPSVVVPGGAA